MADGHVQFIKNSININAWWSLGTIHNGEVITRIPSESWTATSSPGGEAAPPTLDGVGGSRPTSHERAGNLSHRALRRRSRTMEPNEGSETGAAEGDSGPDHYEEFLKLFARDRERIFSYIYSLLQHHADSEDVFQRCSLLLWRKFSRFDREGSFLSWACGVALYEVRNFLRVAGRDRMQLDVDLISQLGGTPARIARTG